MHTVFVPTLQIADKRLKTNSRFWELALGCRIDADPVREIQGCTPK